MRAGSGCKIRDPVIGTEGFPLPTIEAPSDPRGFCCNNLDDQAPRNKVLQSKWRRTDCAAPRRCLLTHKRKVKNRESGDARRHSEIESALTYVIEYICSANGHSSHFELVMGIFAPNFFLFRGAIING